VHFLQSSCFSSRILLVVYSGRSKRLMWCSIPLPTVNSVHFCLFVTASIVFSYLFFVMCTSYDIVFASLISDIKSDVGCNTFIVI